VVVDFRGANIVHEDVLLALVEFVGQARSEAVPVQIVSREGTYVHDLLKLFGILDRLDSTDRLPGRSSCFRVARPVVALLSKADPSRVVCEGIVPSFVPSLWCDSERSASRGTHRSLRAAA
jgi:hypothetical protein